MKLSFVNLVYVLTLKFNKNKINVFINKYVYFILEVRFMPAKKQITRDMILTTALKLLKEKGFGAVTIKQLAGRLKCSTQPIYLSFSGMDDLRNELIPLAIREFENYIKNNNKDGVVRVYDMSYIAFAKNESQLFCFLFMRANSFLEIKRTLLPLIEKSIRELMEIYHISYEEADSLHDHLWMHAHGIASMVATKFCDWDMSKVEHMLEECKCTFTKKYEVQNVYK